MCDVLWVTEGWQAPSQLYEERTEGTCCRTVTRVQDGSFDKGAAGPVSQGDVQRGRRRGARAVARCRPPRRLTRRGRGPGAAARQLPPAQASAPVRIAMTPSSTSWNRPSPPACASLSKPPVRLRCSLSSKGSMRCSVCHL